MSDNLTKIITVFFVLSFCFAVLFFCRRFGIKKFRFRYKDIEAEFETNQTLEQIANKPDTIAEKQNFEVPEENIDGYAVSVVQVGGAGSRLLTKTAWLLGEHGYLNPDKYISVGFNGGGDIMWLYCKDGYKIDSYSSETGNQIIDDSVDSGYCGISIEGNLKNELTLECSSKGVVKIP